MANVQMVAPASAFGTQIFYEDGTLGPVVPASGLISVPQNEVNNMLAAGYQVAAPLASATDGITAHAGGGQANAVLLSAQYSRITTVATAADSVRLPPALPGMSRVVSNQGTTNSMNVFPATGEQINALGANGAYALATLKTVTFYCMSTGIWHTMLTA